MSLVGNIAEFDSLLFVPDGRYRKGNDSESVKETKYYAGTPMSFGFFLFTRYRSYIILIFSSVISFFFGDRVL